MLYQVIKLEQINEYGEQKLSRLETYDDYNDAYESMLDYIKNNDRIEIEFGINQLNDDYELIERVD